MTSGAEDVRLSVTAPASHVLRREVGVGSLRIGPDVAPGEGSALRVDADAVIDWACFDRFTTPAGAPWPRWFHYRGDDADFFAWAQHRRIEEFGWHPSRGHRIHAGGAQIGSLTIEVLDAPMRIGLPARGLHRLGLRGTGRSPTSASWPRWRN